MRTTTQELLHLRRSDFSALPCIGPGGFGRRWVVVDGGEFGGLFGSAGLFAPKDTGEEGHFRGDTGDPDSTMSIIMNVSGERTAVSWVLDRSGRVGL